MENKKKYGKDGYYIPRLLIGSSAYFKNKNNAKKFRRDVGGKLKKTQHPLRGKGWIVFK